MALRAEDATLRDEINATLSDPDIIALSENA